MNKEIAIPIITTLIGVLFGFLMTERDHNNMLHDYQITVKNDSITVYDSRRLVGTCTFNSLDSLITKDNQ